MVTIKRPISIETGPTSPRPQGHDLLCFGSIEWRADVCGPAVRNAADAFEVQHWRYQSFLDQQSRRWVEIPAPLNVKVELQPAVRDGDVVRTTFMLIRDEAAKQSVRVSLKPNVRWVGPGDCEVGRVKLVPAELYFEPNARRLPAIQVQVA